MGSPELMKSLLARVANRETLSEGDAEAAFDVIMSGDATPAQIAGFLMALRVRGETVAEITGATRIMRAKASPMSAPPIAATAEKALFISICAREHHEAGIRIILQYRYIQTGL